MKARENIRLWFEFYKLAFQGDGKNKDRYKKHLESSKAYYSAWGDCRNVSFVKWWKDHKHLFDEVTVREVTEIDNDPSAIYLKVPLSLPLTVAISRIKWLVNNRQGKVRKLYTKSKGVAVSSYQLTPGTEFRADRNNHTLIIYRDLYLKQGQPSINPKFVQSIQDFYKQRSKAKKALKPPSSFSDGMKAGDDAVRTCRRYIKDAERLILAAAKGDFPGRN